MSATAIASFVCVLLLLVGVAGYFYWTKRKNQGATPGASGAPLTGTDPPLSADPTQTTKPETITPPTWANGPTTWDKLSQAQHANNVTYLTAKVGSDESKPLDVVFYGDELVQEMRRGEATWKDKSPWLAVFPENEFRTALLGVPGVGGSVEGLAWRLISGTERPRKDPKCLVLYVGKYNLATKNAAPPADLLKVLLTWLTKSMPTANIVVLGLLPDPKLGDVIKQTNAAYKQLVAEVNKENGNMILYLDCAANVDPRSAPLFAKSSPSPNETEAYKALHTAFFRCLLTTIKPLMDNSV